MADNSTDASETPSQSLFLDSAGNVVPLAEEQGQALGYRRPTPEQIQAHQEAQQYGATGQAAGAGLESFGNALTFGLSTQAETALGVDPEAIQKREEHNPVAAGLGTALGVALPTILSGGEAAPAEGANAARAVGLLGRLAKGTAPGLASEAGRAVESLAAKALTSGASDGARSLVGSIVEKAAAKGLGSAIEGAAYGLGQSVHEDALGQPGFTASALMHNVGLSAALGGGFGAALGLGEAAIPEAVSAARSRLSSIFGRADSAAEDLIRSQNPGEMTDWLLANRGQVARMAESDPDIALKLQTIGDPGFASKIASSWDALGDPAARATVMADHAVTKITDATAGDLGDWMAANKARLVGMEARDPGITAKLQVIGDPKLAEDIADSWASLGDRGVQARILARQAVRDATGGATGEMQGWMRSNADRLAAMEARDPGIVAKLQAIGSPDTAEEIASGFDKILRDPKARDKIVTEFAGHLEEEVNSIEQAAKQANMTARPEEIGRLLPGPATADQLSAAGEWGKGIESAVAKMKGEPDLYPQGYARQLELLKEGLERDIKPEADAADVFNRLRKARQQIDDLIPYKKLDDLPFTERNAIKELRGLRSDLKGALTDEDAWGEAASRQAAFDDAQSDYFRALKRMRSSDGFLKKIETPEGIKFQVAPTKANTFLNQAGSDLRGSARSQVLQEYRAAAAKMLDQIEASYRGGTAKAFDRKYFTSLVDKSAKLSKDAEEIGNVTRLRNAADPRTVYGSYGAAPITQAGMDAQSVARSLKFSSSGRLMAPGLEDAVSDVRGLAGEAKLDAAGRLVVPGLRPAAEVGSNLAGEAGLGLGLHAVGVPHVPILGAAYAVGKAVKGAVELVHDVPRSVQTLARLEAMIQKANNSIERGISAMTRIGASAPAQAVARAARSTATAGTSIQVARRAIPDEGTHERRVRRIDLLGGNMEQFASHLGQATDGLSDHAPKTAQAAQDVTTRAVQFLQSKIPRSDPSGPLAAPPTPTAAQRAEFATYWRAVSKPLSVLRDAREGRLNPKSVEAVRAVHPDIYARIQSAALEKLATVRNGQGIPYQQRQQLSTLLGIDLDGSRRAMPSIQQTFRQAEQATQAAPAPRAVNFTLGERALTPVDRRSAR